MPGKRGILLTAFVLFFLGSYSQDSMGVILPSFFYIYNQESGLPVIRTESSHMDNNGRLWLAYNPTDKDLFSSTFYQFDGLNYQGIFINSNTDSIQPKIQLLKQNLEGHLYGYLKEEKKIFFFDTEKYSFRLISLEKYEGTIRNFIQDENGQYYIYLLSSSSHQVFRLLNEKVEKILEYPNNYDLKLLDREAILPIEKEGNNFWFFSDPTTLIQFNEPEQKAASFPLHTLLPFEEGIIKNSKNPITLKVRQNHTVLIAHRWLKYPILFNPESFTFKELDIVPEPWRGAYSNKKPPIYWDEKGNIILVYFHPELTGCKYILLENNGRFWDYTPIIKNSISNKPNKVLRTNSIQSENFFKHAILNTQRGLCFVQPALKAGIHHYKQGNRGMINLDNDQFLVTNDAGHLWKFDLLQKDISRLNIDKKLVRTKFDASFAETENQFIWFPKRFVGLNQYDYKNDSIAVFEVGLKIGKVYAYHDKELILVSIDNKVYLYNYLNQELKPLVEDGEVLDIQGHCNDVWVDEGKNIWMASQEGLWFINPQEKAYKHLDIIRQGNDKQIMCIYPENNGRLWLGTLFNGIYIYDPTKGSVEIINESKGLSNNKVVGIQEDKEGMLWVSTYYGLNLLNKDRQVLTSLFKEDGLSENEFNRWSSGKSANGQLLFGGIRGLNIIEPKQIKDHFLGQPKAKMYLSQLSFFDKKNEIDTILKRDFKNKFPLQLSANKSSLQLEFRLASYIHPEENTFEYLIDGVEEQWIYLGNKHNLQIPELAPGHYSIFIRGRDFRGRLSENTLEIPIVIKRSFFQSSWFKLSLFLFLITMGGFLFRNYQFQRKTSNNTIPEPTFSNETQKQQSEAALHFLESPLLSTPATNQELSIGYPLEDPFIQLIQKEIEKNLKNESFGVEELCQSMNMSRSKVYKKIKALTGESTSHFIRSIRLQKSKELLEQKSDLSISEIGFQVGYPNLKYFSRIFGEKYGMSPRQYRKKYQNTQ